MDLKKYTVITKAEVKKELGCSDDYAYTVLDRLHRRNKIQQIQKGIYTASEDIYSIATAIHTPSYISFWTASYLKGYTEQLVTTVQVASTKAYREVEFNEQRIRFQQLPKEQFFGYEKQRSKEGAMFIVDDEKLLIDSLTHQRLLGNFDEILKILENITVDKEKLIKYLKRINNTALYKRVGFLLERYKNIDISKEVKITDKNYTQLSVLELGSQTDAKWRVKHDLT